MHVIVLPVLIFVDLRGTLRQVGGAAELRAKLPQITGTASYDLFVKRSRGLAVALQGIYVSYGGLTENMAVSRLCETVPRALVNNPLPNHCPISPCPVCSSHIQCCLPGRLIPGLSTVGRVNIPSINYGRTARHSYIIRSRRHSDMLVNRSSYTAAHFLDFE
jgi:hypothetical protein